MTSKTLMTAGFTLVETMVVVAVIGVVAAIALPNMVKARELSQQKACVSNLKQITAAISNWGLEQGMTAGDPIVKASIFGSTNYIRAEPVCPAGGTYTYFNVGDIPEVSCNRSGHSF